MAKKSKYNWKQAVAVGTAALATSGIFWWIKSPSGGNSFRVPAYRAARVIDGDTFETAESHRIRLSGVDAPEIGRCGANEAKAKLEQLIMGKNLYLKVIIRDPNYRFVAHVYNEKGLVQEQMAAAGYVYLTGDGIKDESINKAINIAREKKLGIFSERCTQTINREKPKCVIKGNIAVHDKKQRYSFPGCSNYDGTLVQLFMGDQWFCTEKEAHAAGFIKSGDCFGRSWK